MPRAMNWVGIACCARPACIIVSRRSCSCGTGSLPVAAIVGAVDAPIAAQAQTMTDGRRPRRHRRRHRSPTASPVERRPAFREYVIRERVPTYVSAGSRASWAASCRKPASPITSVPQTYGATTLSLHRGERAAPRLVGPRSRRIVPVVELEPESPERDRPDRPAAAAFRASRPRPVSPAPAGLCVCTHRRLIRVQDCSTVTPGHCERALATKRSRAATHSTDAKSRRSAQSATSSSRTRSPNSFRTRHVRNTSRSRASPEVCCQFSFTLRVRGRRESRVRAAPAVSCATRALIKTHTSVRF